MEQIFLCGVLTEESIKKKLITANGGGGLPLFRIVNNLNYCKKKWFRETWIKKIFTKKHSRDFLLDKLFKYVF